MTEEFFKSADRTLLMKYMKRRTDMKAENISRIMSKVYNPHANTEMGVAATDDKMIELI